jgi:DNA end-binding protein Ku
MKSLWNIILILGSFKLPVKVLGATRKSNPEFELIDTRDLSKIKFLKCNATTGEFVPNEFIGKAYNENGILIPVLEKFKKSRVAVPENTLSFDHFVNASQVPLIYHENFFALVPDPAFSESLMNYGLLRDELFQSNLMGISNGVFRNQNCLYGLSSDSNVLILHKLRYNEQIEFPELSEINQMALKAGFRNEFSSHIYSRVIGFHEHPFKDEISDKIRAKLLSRQEQPI